MRPGRAAGREEEMRLGLTAEGRRGLGAGHGEVPRQRARPPACVLAGSCGDDACAWHHRHALWRPPASQRQAGRRAGRSAWTGPLPEWGLPQRRVLGPLGYWVGLTCVLAGVLNDSRTGMTCNLPMLHLRLHTARVGWRIHGAPHPPWRGPALERVTAHSQPHAQTPLSLGWPMHSLPS